MCQSVYETVRARGCDSARMAYAAAGAVKVDAIDAETDPTATPRRKEYLISMLNPVCSGVEGTG